MTVVNRKSLFFLKIRVSEVGNIEPHSDACVVLSRGNRVFRGIRRDLRAISLHVFYLKFAVFTYLKLPIIFIRGKCEFLIEVFEYILYNPIHFA